MTPKEQEWHELDSKRRADRQRLNTPTPPLKNTTPPPTILIKYYTAKVLSNVVIVSELFDVLRY